MAWNLRYDGAVPPLPAAIRVGIQGDEEAAEQWFRESLAGERPLLRPGAWSVRLQPEYADDVEREFDFPLCYDGVLRMQFIDTESHNGCRIRGSGDLYRCLSRNSPLANRLRTYPILEYRYYCRLESLDVLSRYELRMELDLHRFEHAESRWSPEGRLQAILLRRLGPGPLLFQGEVRNESGVRVAEIQMRHVADHFREATVQMARVERADYPPGTGEDGGEADDLPSLTEIFRQAGWEVQAKRDEDEGKKLVEEPTGAVWSNKHLHATMLERRGQVDALNREWIYHLLCVRRIDRDLFFKFGRLYDAWPSDSNNVPREGVVVAHQARFPLEPELYGEAAGQVLGRAPKVYLHVAAHELGHAMGLAHNFAGTGIMQGIDNLAASAKRQGKVLADVIELRFDEEDANRLRHLPDIWVRPGGVSFLSGFAFEPVPAEDLVKPTPGLVLRVRPKRRTLPLGAPLRLTFELRNEGQESVEVPEDISLQSGHLAGRVVQDTGNGQEFAGIVRYVFGAELRKLPPPQRDKDKAESSNFRAETLLRGVQGALLPSPGVYRIEVEVAWDDTDGRVRVTDSASVLVHEHKDAEAALRVLSSRESLLPLVFKTRSERQGHQPAEVEEAEKALKEALDSEVLKPHFAVIEAKRLLAELEEQDPGQVREQDYEEAAKLITETEDLVMTPSEAASIHGLLRRARVRLEGEASAKLKELAEKQRKFRSAADP